MLGAPIVTAGSVEVDVDVDVDVDESAASLTFTARPSPQYFMRQLLALQRSLSRDRVHVHDHVHDHVLVQGNALRVFGPDRSLSRDFLTRSDASHADRGPPAQRP
jgi:hypothetical protein